MPIYRVSNIYLKEGMGSSEAVMLPYNTSVVLFKGVRFYSSTIGKIILFLASV